MLSPDTKSPQNAEIATTNPDEIEQRVARAFRDAGEELYLVGGAVRAQLLGLIDHNLDFATSARPGKTLHILERLGVGTPYGLGEKFGTIVLQADGWTLDVTTYRSKEDYPEDSRKPAVTFGETLLDDLTRRDFTINAMAQDPLSGELIDPLGGRDDLARGLIRAVGTPTRRFKEDPLRLLRAVRFAARFEMEIETQTWAAMCECARRLRVISRERIRDEYTKILESADAARGLTLLRDADLMANSVPRLLELTTMRDHGPRHPLSLWDHTMRVVAGVPPLIALRWAALLHDIAKPSTRTHEPSGRPRFFHHEEIGAAVARDILTGLHYGRSVVDGVSLLIETHMQLHSYNPEWSDGAVRRLMLRLGPRTEEAILLARADAAGHAPPGHDAANASKFDHLETRIRTIGQAQVEAIRSPLSGTDLMERYGRQGGPWIRRIKNSLEEDVVEGRLDPDDRESAWRQADALMANES